MRITRYSVTSAVTPLPPFCSLSLCLWHRILLSGSTAQLRSFLVFPSESPTRSRSAHASRPAPRTAPCRAPRTALRTVRHTMLPPWSPLQTITRPRTCLTARCVRRSVQPFPRTRCRALKARHRRRPRPAVRAAAVSVTVAEAPVRPRPRPTTTLSGAARVAAACYADLTRGCRSASGSGRQGYVGRTRRLLGLA